MMSKYRIRETVQYVRLFKKLRKKKPYEASLIVNVVEQLSIDPFATSLRTRKVNSKLYGECYSSRVTGDLRIIWTFIDNKVVILTLALGGHEGRNSVYK